MGKFKLFGIQSLAQIYDSFFEDYKFLSIYHSDLYKRGTLTNRGLRVCRFCQRRMPDVTFRIEAHVVPQLLGKQNCYISDFECDECNVMFSSYENDLGSYLKLEKTIQGIQGKNKKFAKFQNKDIRIENVLDKDSNRLLTVESNDKKPQTISFDKGTGNMELNIKDAGYISLNVYKSLLKIALGCLPSNAVSMYVGLLKILQDKWDVYLQPFAQYVQVVETDFRVPYTSVVIYQKSNSRLDIQTHYVQIYFNNKMFGLHLPFNIHDRTFFDLNSIADRNVVYSPPMYTISPNIDINVEHLVVDFSGKEITNRNVKMKMQIDVNQLQLMNPETKKFVDLENANITGFVFVPNGKEYDREYITNLVLNKK